MSSYNELIIDCVFKQNIPEKIINTIEVLIKKEGSILNGRENPFNFCYNNLECINNTWYLSARNTYKECPDNNEMEFLEMIEPYIESAGSVNGLYAVLNRENLPALAFVLDTKHGDIECISFKKD